MTNSIEKLFETATREKFKFPFKGQIKVEDLWDLSGKELNSIFMELNSELKKATEESLLKRKSPADKELEAKIELVKYIYNVKEEEAEFKLKEKERKEMVQKLLEIKASKQDEDLKNKTPEEIDAMIAEYQKN